MAEHVCPWWLGYALISPLRRLWQKPRGILVPYVRDGMIALEPGPGMGYFTLELARLVGSTGRVIAVDLQPKMLEALARRAERANLAGRISAWQAKPDSLGIEELAGRVDFVLAFAVVHELPDQEQFFKEIVLSLKPGGKVLLSEPRGHVNSEAWNRTLQTAARHGLAVESHPVIARSLSAVLVKQSHT